MLVFWVLTSCGLVSRYQHFGGTYWPHLIQNNNVDILTAVRASASYVLSQALATAAVWGGGGGGGGGRHVKGYEEIRFLLRQEKCKVLSTWESRLLSMVTTLFIFHFSLSPCPLVVIVKILLSYGWHGFFSSARKQTTKELTTHGFRNYIILRQAGNIRFINRD
jgi:hypothetical protein